MVESCILICDHLNHRNAVEAGEVRELGEISREVTDSCIDYLDEVLAACNKALDRLT